MEDKIKELEERIEELESWRERILQACDTFELDNQH